MTESDFDAQKLDRHAAVRRALRYDRASANILIFGIGLVTYLPILGFLVWKAFAGAHPSIWFAVAMLCAHMCLNVYATARSIREKRENAPEKL